MFDPTRPFRGSHALAARHLARGTLYGPQFRRLLPDVHVAADVPVGLTLRSLAAAVLVGPTGVLAGYAAAELLGASCGPADAPVDVILLPPHQRRPCPGLRVHRDALTCNDVVERLGVALTAPLQTAYDLGRWAPDEVEAVVALDALVRHAGVCLDACADRARARPGARGARQLRAALQLARPGADSPMETRARLALVNAGLPEPVMQHPVSLGGRTRYLDLAYPELMLAIEYDGAEHRTAARARRDLVREAELTRAGWRILRFSASEVLYAPRAVAARVADERERALRRIAG